MFQSKSAPFEDDVGKATHENNLAEDWSLIMQICDNAVNYQEGTKFCYKAIIKRLHHNVPRVVMQTLTLLDSCVKNCDRRFLLQVASNEFITEVRKLLGKMHPSCAVKLKELLQKWSLEEFKDDAELCIIPALYYKLKSEGVEFPPLEQETKSVTPVCNDPNTVASQEEENDIIKAIEMSLKDTGRYSSTFSEMTPGLSLSNQADKPAIKPFKVKAIYDFEAAEDNELTIMTGEEVLVTDNSNSSWWKGSNHRGEGLFPANFVSEDLFLNPIKDTRTEVTGADEIIDNETVAIDEAKIDKVLNWLNDVDPTEDLTDPEDMIKLEKECYKMGPMIEEHLQAIDNRLALLDATNEKIMEAFDLFHEISNCWTSRYPATPAEKKISSTSMHNHHAEKLAASKLSQPGAQNEIPPSSSESNSVSQEQFNRNQNEVTVTNPTQNQSINFSTSLNQAVSNNPAVLPVGTISHSHASHLPVGQTVQPTDGLNPYATNSVDKMFVPPHGAPLPFSGHPQQGLMPYPGSFYPYMGMPYTLQPGPPLLYSNYYVNNSQLPTTVQSNNTIASSNLPPNSTMSASTSVTNVPSSNPVPSTTNYNYYNDLQLMTSLDTTSTLTPYSSKQENNQGISNQASGDGQVSSSSSGESS